MMRNAIIVAALVIVSGIAACANDPWQPSSGGCTSPSYPSSGSNCGTPPPTPTPTPTPGPTPTKWPHAPDMAYDGQFGGIGVAAALVDANVTIPLSTIEDPAGAIKAVTDCFSLCDGAMLYEDIIRIDRTGQPNIDFALTCDSDSDGDPIDPSDGCYMHRVGPTPIPTAGSNPGDRTVPASNGNLNVSNSDPSNAAVQAWWTSFFQGTQAAGIGHVNANLNLIKYFFSDTTDAILVRATKLTNTMTIHDDATWRTYLYQMLGGLTHVNASPYLVDTNSLQYGQTGTPGANNGDISCDWLHCLDQFTATSNIVLGTCEFCVQNGVNGPNGTGLVFLQRFVNYALNVASQVDALGKGMTITGEAECGTAGCNNFTGATPAPDAAAPIADRMGHFATWFMGIDNGPNAPSGSPVFKTSAGQPASVILDADFNNHNDNANSVSVFDEQYIVPIGDPNVQAPAYVHNDTGAANGFGRCDTTGGDTPDTGGADAYALSGTCDSSGSKREPVLRKCYHAFSYHNVPVLGDICVFLNLSASLHTIVSGDHTGYTLTHTYAAASTCTQTPNCGDYVTGGTANSQCGGTICAGSITAGTFTDGSTVVAANGGVVVGTP